MFYSCNIINDNVTNERTFNFRIESLNYYNYFFGIIIDEEGNVDNNVKMFEVNSNHLFYYDEDSQTFISYFDYESQIFLSQLGIDLEFIENFDRNPIYDLSIIPSTEGFTEIPQSYYFENLTTNYPTNDDGSCSLVSIMQLLTYLDIFKNDNVIDNDLITSVNVNNSYDVKDATTSPGPNEDFKNILIDLGKGMFKSDDSYGLYPDDIYTLFASFMTTESGLFSSAYTITKNQYGTTLDNFVMDQIDNGIPVILNLSTYEYQYINNEGTSSIGYEYGRAHAFIAYGYKIINGTPYYKCHLGWHDGGFEETYVKPITINGYGALTLNLTSSTHVCNRNAYIHKHSNTCSGFGLCHNITTRDSYLETQIVSYTQSSLVCPACKLVYVNFSASNHNYDYHSATYTSIKHTLTCTGCNKTIIEDHNLVFYQFEQKYHCTKCPYTTSAGLVGPGLLVYLKEYNIEEYLEEGGL